MVDFVIERDNRDVSQSAQLGYYCCSYSQVFCCRDEVLPINLFTTRNLANTELIPCQQQTGDNAFPLLLIDFSLHIIISNTKKLQWEINPASGRCLLSAICCLSDSKNQVQRGLKLFVWGLPTRRKKLDNHSVSSCCICMLPSCLVIIESNEIIVSRGGE